MADRNDETADTIRFVHNWSFYISSRLSRNDRETFTTAYNLGLAEWHISIHGGDPLLFRIARGRQNIVLTLEPSFHTNTLGEGDAVKCDFRVKVIDPANEENVMLQESHTTYSRHVDDGDFGFQVPRDSSLGMMLQNMVNVDDYAGKLCEISSTVYIRRSAFTADAVPSGAPNPPPSTEGDFRFAAINDTSRHNLIIVCRDAPYPVNKESVYMCSPWFRRILDRQMDASEIADQLHSKAAVEIVVFYMCTGRFKAPSRMSSELAKEVMECADIYGISAKTPLFRAIEKMCCVQLEAHAGDVDAVASWLVTASKCDFGRLMNSASALLLSRHWNDFVNCYANDRSSGANAAVREALNERRGFRQPAMMRIQRLRRGTQPVMTVVSD